MHVCREAPLPGTELGARRQRPLVEPRIAARLDRPAEQPVRLVARDAICQHVDKTGRRRISVQQRGRSADHLDAIDDQWIEGDCVIVRQGRHVEHIAAVLVHLHAFTAGAPDHRTAGLWTEPRCTHARLVCERLADAGGAGADEVVTAEHARGGGAVLRGAAQRRGGDDHFLQRVLGSGGFRRRDGSIEGKAGSDEQRRTACGIRHGVQPRT